MTIKEIYNTLQSLDSYIEFEKQKIIRVATQTDRDESLLNELVISVEKLESAKEKLYTFNIKEDNLEELKLLIKCIKYGDWDSKILK